MQPVKQDCGTTVRLFIAIELDERVKAALKSVQTALGQFSREVRWTRPEQMHLTMKFLGEVAGDQAAAVCSATQGVAGELERFEIALAGCGCFPPRGAVRIVHCGVTESAPSLQRCYELCEAAFEGLGFAREQRPFRPHLTVGRVREDRTAGRLRSAVEGASCRTVGQTVGALCVVQSELGPGGACYSNVAKYKLTGAS